MGIRDTDHDEVRSFLKELEEGGATRAAGPRPGSTSHFAYGGPTYQDGYRSISPPTTTDLLNGYRGVAYACARLNANGVARTKLRLYATTSPGQGKPRVRTAPVTRARRDFLETLGQAGTLTRGDCEVDEVMEHPILGMLSRPSRKPDNPFKGVRSLLFFLQLSMETTGSGYWWHNRDGIGVPTELLPLSPRDVKPIPFGSPREDGRIIDHYLDGWGQPIRPEQIARFRFYSLTNPYVGAYGPLEACMQELKVRDKFGSSIDALLSNVFHPSAIISSKDNTLPIGEEARARLEIDLRRGFSRGQAGRPLISETGLDYHAWHQQQADTGGLEVTKEAKVTICNCFDVPVPLLEMTDSNLASASAAGLAHKENAIAPRCELLGEQMTGWAREMGDSDPASATLGPTNWDRIFLAFDNPVPEDAERKSKIQVSMVEAGIWTINKVLNEQGEEPVAWGDEPWLPSTLRQPSEERPAVAPPGEAPPPRKKDKS